MSKEQKAYNQQNLENDLGRFQEILNLEPDNRVALEGAARNYFRLKNDIASLDCCARALAKNKSLIWPHLVESYVLHHQNRIEDCKREARLAIEAAPMDWETNFWWGTLLVDDNKIEEGLLLLEKAASLETNNWSLYTNLAWAYQKKGDLKKNLQTLRHMNQLRPKLSVSLLLQFANIFDRGIWVLVIHYLLIVLALLFNQQAFLLLPAIIDILWVIPGGILVYSEKKIIGTL